ncbi:MAG: hypothetical protein FWD00_03655 [Clostridiales bacterium]|nr:hypothetical protein [Clostridiales bacterium]
MNPCELNALITSIANFLYTSLSEKEFALVNILVSELSKSMFSMELLRAVSKKHTE